MPGQDSLARRALGAALIIAASAVSVFAVRGVQKPYNPDAPAYRQHGPPQARITVVEYSDFQCPACRFAVAPLKQISALYGSDLRLIYKHYPLLRTHPLAKPAAIAAECAGRQGRFWDFHDRLYDSQQDWATDKAAQRLEAYARDLKLDVPAFKACLADPGTEAMVARDIKEGNDRWVVSTPTFFINGRRFVGASQLSSRGIWWIDKSLKR